MAHPLAPEETFYSRSQSLCLWGTQRAAFLAAEDISAAGDGDRGDLESLGQRLVLRLTWCDGPTAVALPASFASGKVV